MNPPAEGEMVDPPAEGETVNPPAEEESKKMSKRARWRRNKKKNLLTEAAEVHDSSAEKEEVHDSSAEKEEVRDSSAEKEDMSLCSLVCDLLFSLPRSSYKSWDEGITREMLVGLKMCAAADWCGGLGSDAAVIDLRGQSATYALRFLVSSIHCASRQPELRYLKVRIGCKKHGLGQGKLKKEIIKNLNGDDSIKWVEEDNGTIISIELDPSHSHYALGWYSSDCEEPLDF